MDIFAIQNQNKMRGHVCVFVCSKDNHHLFPNLAAVAKQNLAVQALSASSERMFSKANILIDWKRSRIEGQVVTPVILLLGKP